MMVLIKHYVGLLLNSNYFAVKKMQIEHCDKQQIICSMNVAIDCCEYAISFVIAEEIFFNGSKQLPYRKTHYKKTIKPTPIELLLRLLLAKNLLVAFRKFSECVS